MTHDYPTWDALTATFARVAALDKYERAAWYRREHEAGRSAPGQAAIVPDETAALRVMNAYYGIEQQKPRRVAIVGSRDYPDLDAVRVYVAALPAGTVVVSGGAIGVDTVAEQAARARGLEVIVHKPDWNRYGKSAGFRRNTLIVADADEVVAFQYNRSRGTQNSIDTARKMNKPVTVIDEVGERKAA